MEHIAARVLACAGGRLLLLSWLTVRRRDSQARVRMLFRPAPLAQAIRSATSYIRSLAPLETPPS